MAPTLSLFSRRKTSTSEDDRALRDRLSPRLPSTPPPPPPPSTTAQRQHGPHQSVGSRTRTVENLTLYPPQSPAIPPHASLVRSSSDASLHMSRGTTRTQTPESMGGASTRRNDGGRKQMPTLTPLSSTYIKNAKRKGSSSSIAFSATSTSSSAAGSSGFGAQPQNIPLPESVPSTPATATLPLIGGGRAFFGSGKHLPISPPLSPESSNTSPGGFMVGKKRSENDALHVSMLMSKTPITDTSDPTRALQTRIAHLETTNNSLTSELSQHSTRITNLLHSHAAVVASLKESHQLELSSAQTAAWASASNELSHLNTRIAQLEYLCESLSSDPENSGLTQQLLNEQRLRGAAEQATLKAREDLETVLTSEREHARSLAEKVEKAEQARLHAQQRAKQDLDYVLTEEEKRRAELNWVFGEKMERLESHRKRQEAEFKKVVQQKQMLEAQLDAARKEMAELKLSEKANAGAGAGGNQTDRELLQLNQTLTSRLAAEKKKNQSLEANISSITERSLATVSSANHDVQKLRNTIEDLSTSNSRLDSELKAIRKERDELSEAWESAFAEVETRDERIKSLEEECGELRDNLAAKSNELEVTRLHAEAQENLFATLSPVDDIGKTVRDLKDDIELYKADIRVYKRDVRKRDSEIKRLKEENLAVRKALEDVEGESGGGESGASRGSSGLGLINSFPEPTSLSTNNNLRAEVELLRAANEELRKESDKREAGMLELGSRLRAKEKEQQEKSGVKRTASRRPKEGGVEVSSSSQKKRGPDRIVQNPSPPPSFPVPQIPTVLSAPPPVPSPAQLTAMLAQRPPSHPPPPRPPPKDPQQPHPRSSSAISGSTNGGSARTSRTSGSLGGNRSSRSTEGSVEGRGKDGRRTVESPLPPPPSTEEEEEEEGETYEW